MRKKVWFLCVLLVSLLFTGCTVKTVDDPAERLLLALKEATEVDSERLETQFFRYYQAHNYELAMLPAFEKDHLPSWDDLTLFVLL